MSASSLNLDAQALGQCLTVAQKLAIRNALLKIKLQEKLEDIRFWGKITGQHTAQNTKRQSETPAVCHCNGMQATRAG